MQVLSGVSQVNAVTNCMHQKQHLLFAADACTLVAPGPRGCLLCVANSLVRKHVSASDAVPFAARAQQQG